MFDAITLSVKFQVAEVVEIAPRLGLRAYQFCRNRHGPRDGREKREANQELFIFRKGSDGKWKIARYGFSSTHRVH